MSIRNWVISNEWELRIEKNCKRHGAVFIVMKNWSRFILFCLPHKIMMLTTIKQNEYKIEECITRAMTRLPQNVNENLNMYV